MADLAFRPVLPPSARRWGIVRNLALLTGIIVMAASLASCNGVLVGGSSKLLAGTVEPAPEPPGVAAEHARIVASYGGLYHDARLEALLGEIVSKLVDASDVTGQGYRITMLNAPTVNAFALTGGRLYVTRGLIALASDASELAAVLAHEMAHVTADHPAQRANKAKTAIIVSRVVDEALKDNQAGQLALSSSQRTLASFSRAQELEADAIGIGTVAKAGYDPSAAARFLAAMARFAQYSAANGVAQDKQPEFLASHPTTPERIEQANRAAKAAQGKSEGTTNRDRYLDAIDGLIFSDDSGQGYVRGRNFYHSTLALTFAVPEGFSIDNTSDAVLATGADGTALRFDGVSLPQETALSDYLASGWINGLNRSSVRNFDIGGLPAASATAAAKGWVFRITVIRMGSDAVYRFIFANERDSAAFHQAADNTAASFRQLSEKEIAALKPLRIRIGRVGLGGSQESMAKRMRGVDRPLELFRALNDLESSAKLSLGARVKIVSD